MEEQEKIAENSVSQWQKLKATLSTPKAKKISNIVFTVVEVAIVIFTIVISVMVWVGGGNPDDLSQPKAGKQAMLAIQTDSMMGDAKDNFNPGDLVFVKMPEDVGGLGVGTIIAYRTQIYQNGQMFNTIITHRIIEVKKDANGKTESYVVLGDNTEGRNETEIEQSKDIVPLGSVVGEYKSKLKGLGGAILWLQGYEHVENAYGVKIWSYAGKTNNFLYVIIIPLILLLVWNGYYLVKAIVDAKIKKAKEAAAQAAIEAASAPIDEEEIKRRAIEEYLKSQAQTATEDKPANEAEVPEAASEDGEVSADSDTPKVD